MLRPVDREKCTDLNSAREATLISAAARIAERLEARRLRAGRWVARCPAHADRAPSLSISEGRDGRALLHCFAGCSLSTILSSAGLSVHHLFAAGSQPSRGQLEGAERRRAQQAAGRRRERLRIELLRSQWEGLKGSANRLARTLATMHEDTPGGAELVACFHTVMDELRLVDQAITGDQEWL